LFFLNRKINFVRIYRPREYICLNNVKCHSSKSTQKNLILRLNNISRNNQIIIEKIISTFQSSCRSCVVFRRSIFLVFSYSLEWFTYTLSYFLLTWWGWKSGRKSVSRFFFFYYITIIYIDMKNHFLFTHETDWYTKYQGNLRRFFYYTTFMELNYIRGGWDVLYTHVPRIFFHKKKSHKTIKLHTHIFYWPFWNKKKF
jgi:hypothetical protein